VTRARAPGKIVISGAYAVLAGAPAIVSAVSRYVTADTSRPATFITDEVRAALAPGEQAPWFDASELREDDRKLGLGSSAAILVASLFALEQAREPAAQPGPLLARVNARALQAHRQAQGGGSGVDVAASTFGGTFTYRLAPHGAHIQAVELPAHMTVELWTCPTSAATRELLAAVAQLAKHSPEKYARWMGSQILAAHDAALGAARQDAREFIAALRAQSRALSGLGDAAQVPIVTPELAELAPRAEEEGGVLLPAGAGGGDIALFVGNGPSSRDLRAALENHAHRRLDTDLSAPGVSAIA
jgi:phosphomevalonate kinase